jgi:hypothetical protein
MAEAAGGSSSVALKGLTFEWVDSCLDSQAWTSVQAQQALICFACVAQRNAAVVGRDELYVGICGEGNNNVRSRIAEFAGAQEFRHSPGLVCPEFFPEHLVSAAEATTDPILQYAKNLAQAAEEWINCAEVFACLSGSLHLYVQCNAVEQPAESLRMVAPTHAMQLEAMKAKQMRKYASDPAFRDKQAKRKSGAITNADAYATFLDEHIEKRLAKGPKGDLPLWEFKRPNAGAFGSGPFSGCYSVAFEAKKNIVGGGQLLYELVQEEITKFCSTELLPALCDPHREILAALPTAFEDLLSFGYMCRRFFDIVDRGYAAGSTHGSISFLVINTFCKVVLDSVEVQARLGAALASPDSEAEELANQCRFVVVWTRTFCAVGDSTKCARLCSGSTVFQLIDAMRLLASADVLRVPVSTIWSQKAIPITILEGDEEITYTFPELLATIREGRT